MADISVIRVGTTDYTIKDAAGRALIAEKAPIASPSFSGTPLAPTPDINTDNTQIANTAWVNDRIEASMAAAQAMVYKGTIGTGSSNTWVAPAHSGGGGYDFPEKNDVTPPLKNGDTYIINTAATYFEDSSGEVTYTCEVGDMAVVTHIEQDHAIWTIIQKNIDGAVTGPSSSVNNRVAVFNGTTGKIIKDSGYTIATSVPSGAVFTDTKNTVGATQHTSTLYVVGVLSSGGSASAQSYIDPSFSTTDGVIDCDGANIEGNTVIGTTSVNRTLTVNGTIASTGAITQGGTAVSLATHNHDTVYAPISHSHSSVVDSGGSSYTVTFSYNKPSFTTPSYIAVWNDSELRKLDVDSVCSLINASPVGHTHNYAGSSSAGGAATSANKLNTNAGSGTQPIYFSGGVPVATTYSLAKSVPSDAVFTDTKNTAGSTQDTGKLFLVGAKSQAASAQTYSHINVYEQNGIVYSPGLSISGAATVAADLTVAGGITVDGAVTVGSGMGVTGDLIVTSGMVTVDGADVSLDGHTHGFSGVTKKFAFSGTAGSATASYTPAGTISKPNITVTPSTTTVNSITAVGTLPTWSASVSGETLSFSFSQGTLPTKGANTTVMTGASAALASTPTFTGTAATITSSYTPAGTIAINASTGTGTSYTPEGTVG